MNKTYISIGSDYTMMLAVLDDNKAAVNLTGVARIDLFLQYENEPKILKSFTTNDGTLIVDDAPNGMLKFYLKRADTLTFKHNKDIDVTVKVWETDANFDDNVAKYECYPNYYVTPYKAAGYGG